MAQSPINRPLWSHCPFLRQKSPRCVSKFNDFVKIISKLSFSFRIFLLCGEKKFRWLSFCGFKIWKIWPIKMRNLNSPSCLLTLSLSLSLSLSPLSLSLFLFLNILLSSFPSLLYLVLLCLQILFLLLFCQSRNDQFLAYFYANCMRSI